MGRITARSKGKPGVHITNPENGLFCRLDGLTPAAREFQRFKALTDLGLLKAETVAIFEEATQTAARFLDIPICILGLMTQERQWIKSAVGLSNLGLMNQLATKRQMPRSETFCTYVVDSKQMLVMHNIAKNRFLARSVIYQEYGIRAYLGTPLLTASGICLGTLAVMDMAPCMFSTKDIDFLVLMARWTMSEIERNCALKAQRTTSVYLDAKSTQQEESDRNTNQLSTSSIKVKLLNQLTEELRTPLTSVMGMTSVLNREIYGPLSNKQKEYVDIIHYSGQHLVDLVDEILTLGVNDENNQKLDLRYVDIEMICLKAIKSLEEGALLRQIEMRLSADPENRIWLLDKDKVQQMLYYLIFGMIQSAPAGSTIRIDVTRKRDRLNIALSLSQPWQEDYLTEFEIYAQEEVAAITNSSEAQIFLEKGGLISHLAASPKQQHKQQQLQPRPNPTVAVALATPVDLTTQPRGVKHSRESLGILLSCFLAELHGGQISVETSSESGYCYVVRLPQMIKEDEIS